MIEWRWGRIRFRLSLWFPAMITILLLRQPQGMVVTCLLASLIHESGHLMAMLALGIPPHRCVVGIFGLRMDLQAQWVDYKKSIIISFMGPLVNLLVALLFLARAPSIAAVHFLLAGINLLPVSSLDGGEILQNILYLLGRNKTSVDVLRYTSLTVVAILAAGGGYLMFVSGNPTLLFVSGYLLLLTISSKKCQKNT